MNNLVKTLINRMSKVTGTVLTERHWQILDYAQAYYEQHKVGPLYLNLNKHTGATRPEIDQLFPSGLNSIYSWVGIPIHSTENLCKPLATVDVAERR